MPRSFICSIVGFYALGPAQNLAGLDALLFDVAALVDVAA
jgi:hypothetical protein